MTPMIQVEFERAVNKCSKAGLNMAADFLKTKSRRSLRTSINFYPGLQHFNTFVKSKYNLDLEQIVQEIKQEKLDVYRVLDSFVAYLQDQRNTNGDSMMPRTILTYMIAVKSYFGYADIDIAHKKFQYRVTMPKLTKEDEQAIDANDIREIINHTDNKRLKAYLLVLASGGMLATEALAIREIDINYNGIDFANLEDISEPASVKIRKEYAKTRRERHIFISNEATRYLNDWLAWKYRYHPELRQRQKNHLVFAKFTTNGDATSQHPSAIYKKMHVQFQRALEQAKRDTKKEEGIIKRGLVTFHSFRRYVKTTVANQTRNDAYAEWLIGHAGSPYYANKPEKLKQIYKEDCMKYLTFLDYPTVESMGRSVESQLKTLQKENELLRAQVRHVEVTKQSEATETTNAIADLTNTVLQLQREMNELKSKKKE